MAPILEVCRSSYLAMLARIRDEEASAPRPCPDLLAWIDDTMAALRGAVSSRMLADAAVAAADIIALGEA